MALVDFSESDLTILRDVIKAVKGGRVNTPSRPSGERQWDAGEDHQAPETYIAKAPSGGIPALEDAGTGTGNTEPGKATSDIYRIQDGDITGLPELVRIENLTKLIYNISEEDIDEDTWITVTRTKSGRWVAVVGGGVDQTIRFTIITANCVTKKATVQVDARPCGVTKVPEEDSFEKLIVNDPQGCFLDESNADLVGRKGWAKYMVDDDSLNVCQWDIFSLCCDPDACA